jgi:hypothetical protein
MSKSLTKTILIAVAIIGGIILAVIGLKKFRKNRSIKGGA